MLLNYALPFVSAESESLIPMLSTFCAVFSRLITTLHDDEFSARHDEKTEIRGGHHLVAVTQPTLMPFSVTEIVALSAVLKDVCLGLVELAFPETRPLNEHYRKVFHGTTPSYAHLEEHVKEHLYRVCVNLLRQIYMRDLRRNFCPPNHWTVTSLNLPLDKPADLTLDRRRRNPRPFQPIRDFTREDLDNGPPMSTKQLRSITILRGIPFVVAFSERVNILQGLLAADKLRSQGEFQNFLQGPALHVKVRRTHLYEDAFEKLSADNEPDLRPKLKVQLVNAMGLEEAGIDGGGIFREFLSELIKTAFDPNRGLFMTTTENKLYPNPAVGRFVEHYQRHYYFIGRVLGKALYENLLVDLPLADFFLTKLAGKQCDVDLHQLASLDPVLHKNLLSLKAYDGDVADLGLDFTVVSSELGETRVEELKPGGTNVAVTASNRIEYIQLMADYKLNKQIRRQCLAFREGLNNVLPIEWLFMFSNVELQVLIAGAEIPVDVDDLRTHAKYGGSFDGAHPTIEIFWEVVQSFSDEEKRQLLKFVTSLSRPPLLGFKDLDPPFTIQDAGDTDRLPSASTCMNLLKLPAFQTASVLRQKLLYAITANTGFELS